jgi:hypothetical protein
LFDAPVLASVDEARRGTRVGDGYEIDIALQGDRETVFGV